MNDKDIFISRTKDYGNLVSERNEYFDSLKQRLQIHLQLYKEIYSQGSLPDVFMGLINYDHFLAFTFKEQNRYFIALSTGTIRVLKNLFDYVVLQDVLFKDKVPNKCKQPFKFNPSFNKIIDNFYNYDLEFNLSSKEDTILSKKLLLYSMEIMVMHEFAHIKNGHLDYNTQTDMPYLLFEEDKISSKKENIRKALEYDADMSSMNCIMRKILLTATSTEEKIKELCNLYYALEITFNATGSLETNFENFQYAYYPEPIYRVFYSKSLKLSKKRFPYIDYEVLEIINKSLLKRYLNAPKEMSLLFQRRFIDDHPMFFYATKHGVVYDYIISSSYNKIHKQLQKHAFVMIPPKSQVDLKQDVMDLSLLDYFKSLEE